MDNLRLLVLLLEGTAAISGLYFYRRNPTDKAVGFFVYFLLLTFFVEAFSFIPAIIYFNEHLHFLKSTFLYGNFWLYNPYSIINFVVYVIYFNSQISNVKTVKFINKVVIVYVLICVLNLIFSDVFFQSISVVTYLGGSIFLLGVILYYYFEILMSTKILDIKKEISFYISIITLLYFLTTTPIFIYSKYFTNKSPEFVELSTIVLNAMNIFMYTSYTITFLSLGNKRKIFIENPENAL